MCELTSQELTDFFYINLFCWFSLSICVKIIFRIFLGLTDAVVESVYRTPEGFTTSWVNWGNTEPNDAAQSVVEDCVVRRISDGMWNDLSCSETRGYYCEG